MRFLVLAAAALLARPTDSSACSISGEPAAYVLGATLGKVSGRRPLISLWRVKKPVVVTQVPATCQKATICKGTAVAVDRTGIYLRPKMALPDGARIQVTMPDRVGNKLLADVTIAAGGSPPQLPLWDDVTWMSAKQEKEGMCEPAGPVIRLAVKPTKANLPRDGAWLLIYLEKPDPAQPMTKLAFVSSLDTREIALGNDMGAEPWLKSIPKQIWVMLADNEGNVGPVIQLP